jgi:carbon storage regulator
MDSSRNSVRSKEGSDMLVLSRKLGEKIYINDNICITVVDIDRGKIRLGIEAPRDVPIFRQELLGETGQAQAPADKPALVAKG